MIIDNILKECGSGVSRTYQILQDSDKVFAHDAQDISSNSNNNLLAENMVLEETNFLKKIQVDVESILCLLDDAIVAGKQTSKEIANDSLEFYS